MAKHEQEFHESDSVCPYCQHSFQVEAEDYSEDTREVVCFGCKKKYWLRQDFDVTHYSTPDCELNGQQHQWLATVTPGYERCEECDRFRRAPVTENASES